MVNNRYYVTDLGAESTVTDSLTGEIVFTGPYARALSQAEELNRQASLLYNQSTTVVSSGDVAQNEQQARVSGSETVNPNPGSLVVDKNGRIQPPPDTTSGSNATNSTGLVDNAGSMDFGLDAELRPLIQTQGTAPGASQTSPGPVQADVRRIDNQILQSGIGSQPGGQVGVGARPDDNSITASRTLAPDTGIGGTNSTVSALNSINFDEKIVPQPNVLDQYASYTYQASLYLMTKSSYQRMVNTHSKSLTDAQLIVQTGGAAPGVRSPAFELDYYIDSIELKSFVTGRAVRLAHNVSEVKMTVVEPNGITFLRNLSAAVQQFFGGKENAVKNFTSQIYLLVIKFYGYDDQGNLVRGGVASPNISGDPNSFVEKWYPLIIKKVNFKIANKAVEYEIEAAAPPYYINASQGRGTIPYNTEFSGRTVKEILIGAESIVVPSSTTTTNRNKLTPDVIRRVDQVLQLPQNQQPAALPGLPIDELNLPVGGGLPGA